MGLRNRKAVLREIQRLAQSRVNDAVRLAFMSGEELGGLDRLELSAVTEFKRNSNGTVEMKFGARRGWERGSCDGVFGQAAAGHELVVRQLPLEGLGGRDL